MFTSKITADTDIVPTNNTTAAATMAITRLNFIFICLSLESPFPSLILASVALLLSSLNLSKQYSISSVSISSSGFSISSSIILLRFSSNEPSSSLSLRKAKNSSSVSINFSSFNYIVLKFLFSYKKIYKFLFNTSSIIIFAFVFNLNIF